MMPGARCSLLTSVLGHSYHCSLTCGFKKAAPLPEHLLVTLWSQRCREQSGSLETDGVGGWLVEPWAPCSEGASRLAPRPADSGDVVLSHG